MEYTTKTPGETQNLGRKVAIELSNPRQGVSSSFLAPRLHENNSKNGAIIIGLIGELGAGKTTFTQGFAEGLGIEGRITSPTFTIVREYELKEGKNFYHVDLYRFPETADLEIDQIGLRDVFNDPKAIILIEWANYAKSLPKSTIRIQFENKGEERKLIFNFQKSNFQ